MGVSQEAIMKKSVMNAFTRNFAKKFDEKNQTADKNAVGVLNHPIAVKEEAEEYSPNLKIKVARTIS